MRRLGSLVIAAADRTQVPAGARAGGRSRRIRPRSHRGARSPSDGRDRARGSDRHPRRSDDHRDRSADQRALGDELDRLIGPRNLYFYDAIAPIVTAESIDMTRRVQGLTLRQGRRRLYQLPAGRGRSTTRSLRRVLGGGKDAAASVRAAGLLRRLHADRGDGASRAADAGVRPDAAGRSESIRAAAAARSRWCSCARTIAQGRLYNMVGFQTKMTYPEQRRVLAHDSRPGARRVRAPGLAPSQHFHRFAAPAASDAPDCKRATIFSWRAR